MKINPKFEKIDIFLQTFQNYDNNFHEKKKYYQYRIHQMVSPISSSESTNFFNQYLFSTRKLRKTSFEPIRNFREKILINPEFKKFWKFFKITTIIFMKKKKLLPTSNSTDGFTNLEFRIYKLS